jgi:hypothetical protein
MMRARHWRDWRRLKRVLEPFLLLLSTDLYPTIASQLRKLLIRKSRPVVVRVRLFVLVEAPALDRLILRLPLWFL